MRELRTLRTLDVDDRATRATATFRDRAEEAGLVDVAYTTVDSPVGELLVAGTRRGRADVRPDSSRPGRG